MFDLLKKTHKEQPSMLPPCPEEPLDGYGRKIYIKIHDHANLSSDEIGLAMQSYVTVNKLDGSPNFKRVGDGVFALVFHPTAEEVARGEQELKLKQEQYAKQVLELVRVEAVDAPV